MDHAEVPAPSLITRDVFLDMIKGDHPARGCVKLINVYDELLDEIAGDPPTNTISPSTSGINTHTTTVGLHINPTNAFPSPTFSSYSSLYTSLISSTLSSSPYTIVTVENSHVPSLDLLQSILDGLINVQGYIVLSTPSFWTDYIVPLPPPSNFPDKPPAKLYLTKSPLSLISRSFPSLKIHSCSSLINSEVGRTESSIYELFVNIISDDNPNLLDGINKICRPKVFEDNTTHGTYRRCRVTVLECLDRWRKEGRGDLILREGERVDEELEKKMEEVFEGEEEEDWRGEVEARGGVEFLDKVKDARHWNKIKKEKVRRIIENGESEELTVQDLEV
ncbi:hypothetical protein TrVE_jg1241 [Triparma verrucosa]|uniref:Uncharacterized protein n=1 Tax=Triparma verrucosa TaxID=1606542 RepID=A0A9W7FBS5_9STRA|nr:hypothetical protein TrVE_jg1241 [Triparma verrucosa]